MVRLLTGPSRHVAIRAGAGTRRDCVEFGLSEASFEAALGLLGVLALLGLFACRARSTRSA